MVERDNTLQRVIVDESLIREARRCRQAWHSLQQLGRIGEAPATAVDSAPRGENHRSSNHAADSQRCAGGRCHQPRRKENVRSDEPYIETVRCSSCNECIQLNGKMFAYDANQQAYIVDPDAGTYRELVEAAESCQVAVIHPGKPRNPTEPGLEELLKRAEPFL